MLTDLIPTLSRSSPGRAHRPLPLQRRQAAEVFISAVEQSLHLGSPPPHRQLTTPSQYARALGIRQHLQQPHLLLGDQHALTVGPERAARMDAAPPNASAWSSVPSAPRSRHSGIHVVWCAVNRLTATNQVLGLRNGSRFCCARNDRRRQIKLDRRSARSGREAADFAVLEATTRSTPALKDIGVWGVVQHFPAGTG